MARTKYSRNRIPSGRIPRKAISAAMVLMGDQSGEATGANQHELINPAKAVNVCSRLGLNVNQQQAVSKNQNAILLTIARDGGGSSDNFHQAIFGVPFDRSKRDRALTGSERASLSRAIRRLELRGLIHRRYRWWWVLTDAGCREMERQGVECRKSNEGTLDELESKLTGAMGG